MSLTFVSVAVAFERTWL